MLKVLSGHLFRRKPLLETRADFMAVQFAQGLNRLNGLRLPVHHKTGYTMIYHLRNGATAEGDDRRAARHGFDHDQTERFGPVNRKQQGRRTCEKILFGLIVDFANQLDPAAINERFESLLEIASISARHLCGY